MTAPAFVAAESLVAGWLRSSFIGVRCVTELPDNLETVLPLVRVTRIGGSDRFGLDSATLDFDYFAADRTAARAGALSVLQKLRYEMPGALLGNSVVSKVATVLSPIETPWDNSALRRFTGSVQVVFHSR